MSDKILSTIDGPVGTVIFNNPERRNAVSLEMWREAAAALARFAEDPAVRVIVLAGAGGEAFVSGADISKFDQERNSAAGVASYNEAVERFSRTLIDCDKPTIAKIQGYCIGGGVGIAVCCDLRICTETSRFGVPAAKLGLAYGVEGVRRLIHLVGPQFVNEIFFTARQFDAWEAQRMGLINRVLPGDEIEDHVRELAGTIASNAPLTIRALKSVVRELLKDPAERDLARCDRLVKECFDSSDYREGRRAFLEKRKPVFTGK